MQAVTTNGELESNQAQSLDAKHRLDVAAREGHMTKSGESWFEAVMDPFCDTEIRVTGFPDGSNRQAIVQKIRKTHTITAPTTTDPWDCFIQMWPALVTKQGSYKAPAPTGTDYRITNVFVGTPFDNGNSPNAQIGGATFVACPAGTNWADLSTPGSGISTGHLDCSDVLTDDLNDKGGPMLPARCVAMGFEVSNVTAPLYKAGNVTCFRLPQPEVEDGWFSGILADDTGRLDSTMKFLPQLPNNSAEAFLIPGTTQWPASEGCYIPSRMASVDNPAQFAYPMQLLTALPEVLVPTNPLFSFQNQSVVRVDHDTNAFASQPNWLTPFDHTGAMFTGLTPQTTLVVNTIWYLEQFPNPSDVKLQVLSQLTPPRDAVALELYSQTVDRMPTAVPFGLNPLGEWFRSVVDTLEDLLPDIIPVAGAVGSALFPELSPLIMPATAGLAYGANKLKKQKARRNLGLPVKAKPKATVSQNKKKIRMLSTKLKKVKLGANVPKT